MAELPLTLVLNVVHRCRHQHRVRHVYRHDALDYHCSVLPDAPLHSHFNPSYHPLQGRELVEYSADLCISAAQEGYDASAMPIRSCMDISPVALLRSRRVLELPSTIGPVLPDASLAPRFKASYHSVHDAESQQKILQTPYISAAHKLHDRIDKHST